MKPVSPEVHDETLINALVAELAPVRPMAKTALRLKHWVVLATLIAGGSSLFFTRPLSWAGKLQSLGFWLEMAAILALALGAGRLAFVYSVPQPRMRGTWTILGLAGVWIGILLASSMAPGFFGAPNEVHSHGWVCMASILATGFLPGLAMFWMLRKGASTFPVATGLFGAVAAGAVGAAVLQVYCLNRDGGHLFMAHFGTVALAGLGGLVVGKLALRPALLTPSK